MVNDLTELMRENVAAAPDDHLDLPAVIRSGRRQVRRRHRRRVLGGASMALAGTVLAAIVGLSSGDGVPEIAGDPPRPDAPTLTLDDATRAVEGRDYRELASYTNENLDADNGQYFDGVTDDGLILFRDGPRADQRSARYALMDPETGDKDWLPGPPAGSDQLSPVALGSDQLVLVGLDNGTVPTLYGYVFDRDTRQWHLRQWPDLPSSSGGLVRAVLGPEDRLYVLVPSSDRQGFHIWSASLSDESDVRDEGLVVGELAFTDSAMVWTDATDNDAPGTIHVRDLETGRERSFDPGTDQRCNLLSFGVADDRIMMGQYCGTYDGGVEDTRVQIVSTDGSQVVTIQGDEIDGRLDGANSDVVTVTASNGDRTGTYVYDLSSGRFLRVSDEVSSWGMEIDIAAGPDQFFWSTRDGRHGSTQHLGQLLP
ncbi:MAG TPA: hypothetical protein VGE14_11635 [Marmoricola sp.]